MNKDLMTSIAALALVLPIAAAHGEAAVQMRAARTDAGLELSWPASVRQADGTLLRPYFELQRSLDLETWEPIGERWVGNADATDALAATVGAEGTRGFYRLLAIMPRAGAGLASTGDEVFGYAKAFERELTRIGQITPEEFAAAYASDAEYLPGIGWDPTTGEYWDLFQIDPEVYNRDLIQGVDDRRLTDFRLDARELGVFKRNGFVVSERLGSHSFADVFYRLWKDDLPVFVSTDAILQAWHRTFDMMLEEIEETFLFSSMERMLSGMAAQVPAAWEADGDGELAESLLDAGYFLTVARSLLNDPETPVPSALGQDERVAATLAAIAAEEMKQFELFGACRMVDFSQFKVRGHYEHSERLGRYFQCLMWLGRIDLRVAGGPFQDCPNEAPHMASPREMAGAIVLWDLLRQSGEFDTWLAMDRTIQTFVGWTDSMTFAQLDQLLAAAGIGSLADLPDLAAAERIQQLILAGDLGAQNIRSDFFVSPFGPEQVQLPRSFTVFGQKFTLDSWALKNVVFDDILWTENDTAFEVCRRVPSALDVAFSVLGNDQIVPEIVARITDPNAASSADSVVRLRDGLPYQHNLAAVRNVIDAQSAASWSDTITLGWLDTLRTLSAPTTDVRYPEAMRTRAWALKTLNTQLASWTHLRHDTILYTKQSYTSFGECLYPTGYVEPRPEFWRRLTLMVLRAHELIQGLEYQGEFTFLITMDDEEGGTVTLGEETISLAEVRLRQLVHLERFADTMTVLEEITRKELAREYLSDEETNFLRDLIERTSRLPAGCVGQPKYDGWYPQLFYRKRSDTDELRFQADRGSDAHDAIVADVHTDVPSIGCSSPGHVLHQGVGRVHLLMMAVESGEDRMVVAGPVLSHYEFSIEGPPKRLSDEEWRYDYQWGDAKPEPNEWTRDYLVTERQ